MNNKIRDFARESHLDVYGLGHDHEKWEQVVDRFAQMVVEHCALLVDNNGRFLTFGDMANKVRKDLK